MIKMLPNGMLLSVINKPRLNEYRVEMHEYYHRVATCKRILSQWPRGFNVRAREAITETLGMARDGLRKCKASTPKVYAITHVKTELTRQFTSLDQFQNAKSLLLAEIREHRQGRREDLERSYTFTHRGDSGYKRIHYIKINDVFEKGAILQLSKQLKCKRIFESKEPKDDSTHIAIEIELISKLDKSALAYALYETGCIDYLELKTDGSIRVDDNYPHAHELVVCAPETKVKEVVTKVCEVLAKSCHVNKSCGLHVHLDARNDSPLRMATNLLKAQRYMYLMQPKSRRDNGFCKRLRKINANAINGYTRGCRYKGINVLAYRKHRTIEVRMHSGTINANKIIAWVDFVNSVARAPEINRVRSLGALAIVAKLPKHSFDYAVERIKQFESTESEAA